MTKTDVLEQLDQRNLQDTPAVTGRKTTRRKAGAPGGEGSHPDVPPAEVAGTGGQLTRLTVNLTGRATDALEKASRETGDTKTDTVNRALQVYAVVLDLEKQGGGSIRVVQGDKTIELRLL